MAAMTTEETVLAFVKTRFHAALRDGQLGPDDALFSSGIVDSFGVLELIAFLEDTFAITIDTSRHDLVEFDSVDRIVALVHAAGGTSA